MPSKRRKVGHDDKRVLSQKTGNKGKGKEKAFDRKFIPIPTAVASDDDDENFEMSDQDLDVLRNASFLKNLDQKDIGR